jgi:hypothetical protein
MLENHSDVPVVIGFIAHVHPLFLEQVRKQVEQISHLKIIFYKESQGKLWITSGEGMRFG